jgi:protoporphyrinogen oxidase
MPALRADVDTNRGAPVGIAVLGAGPAGLTASYVLAKRGVAATVFEADGLVGGIAKTVEFSGYRFDLGGHRFFTKLAPIARLWDAILGDELLTRPRLSRIYYGGKYFYYPLEARNVVRQLGLVESVRCALSFFAAVVRRGGPVETFEDWVTAHFGRRLYQRFFRTYTEKVWGIPASEVRAEWAAQRIKDFSFWHALKTLVGIQRSTPTTLIEEFKYPRLGPGQMWEAFRDSVEDNGIPVRLNHRCDELFHSGGRIRSVVVRSGGERRVHDVDGVLSSMPLSALVLSMTPSPPAEVVAAAKRLRYRNLCLVALITSEPEPFPDNWIYLHDARTGAGRVQNFAAWSPDLVQPGTSCLGVEYFCFEGDATWEMPEDLAIDAATRELAEIGLIDPDKVFAGAKVRVPKAYPMYDAHYREAVATIRDYLRRFKNLETCGRNGLHRYNNQDHSMWTAALALANLLDGADHDVWAVNLDEAYLERGEVVEESIGLELLPSPSAT